MPTKCFKAVLILVVILNCFNFCFAQQVAKVFRDTELHNDYFETRETVEFVSNTHITPYYSCSIIKVKAFYKTGILKEEYTVKDDFSIGDYRSYYNNGKLNTIYSHSLGNRDEFYVEFYLNGQMKIAGEYKIFDESPKFQYSNDTTYETDPFTTDIKMYVRNCALVSNIKDGVWSYWEENGKLIKRELWEKGKLIKEY